MTQEQALIPRLLTQRGNKTLDNVISVFLGAMALCLLAQITIPLPWTPVPITGQTFGVALISMTLGRIRGFAMVLTYITIGGLGFPAFALGKSGLLLGPTTGYLIGMALAAYWMGWMSDLGYTKKLTQIYLVALSGSLITFTCGVIGLSFFLPAENLLTMGVLPFLPGDFIKTLLASYTIYQMQKSIKADK